MTTWLIFDGNFVAWRAFHSVGDLSHTGARTGTVFGFFKEVQALQNLFNTRKVIFCFDGQMSHRKALYPEYKANRVEPDDEQKKAAYEEVRKQIALLNAVYLPKIGYKNVFCQQGLEADDLIASILRWNIRQGDKVVIITADKDMYQLLSPDVEIYNLNRPLERRRYTVQDLKREWGLSPLQWRDLKAIAGCETDNVKGCKGVREKTAAKYLRGDLPETHKISKSIEQFIGSEQYLRNTRLTRLPFVSPREDCKLREDEITKEGWESVAKELGIKVINLSQPDPLRRPEKNLGLV